VRNNKVHYFTDYKGGQSLQASFSRAKASQPEISNPAPTLQEYFARFPANIDRHLLHSKRVVIVGVGTVGSDLAKRLARSTVGHLCLIDHDVLEVENLYRHELPIEYVGRNKAEGLAYYLTKQIVGLQTEAWPYKIDQSVSDEVLDELLADADLIIAATDDREAQRRIGRRALALTVPAVFPALYQDGGGEIVVQTDPRLPCFYCWDGFRDNEEQLRGVNAAPTASLPVIETTIELSLAILDPRSVNRLLMVGEPGEPPNQVFMRIPRERLSMAPLERREDCPSCAVGPSSLRDDSTATTWRAPERARPVGISVSQPLPVDAWSSRSRPQANHARQSSDFSGWMGGSIFGTLLMLIPAALIVSKLGHMETTEHFSVGLWLILSVVLGVILNSLFYLKN
jgi:ThiF family